MGLLSVILSGVEESQFFILNVFHQFGENRKRFDSFVSRLSRGCTRRATVHVALPSRSILDFARNDKFVCRTSLS